MVYAQVIRPLVFASSRYDPEVAHERVIRLGQAASARPGVVAAVARRKFVSTALQQTLIGQTFQGVVGMAAGFDKHCQMGPMLGAIFDFYEWGAVALDPQLGNPRPRIFRVPADRALVNRMGFNSVGASTALANALARPESLVPVGLNLGINKWVSASEAAERYAAVAQEFLGHVAFFVINTSSPNTPGLRQLSAPEYVYEVTAAVRQVVGSVPVLNKLSPDDDAGQTAATVDSCEAAGSSGYIVANTTITRPGRSVWLNETGGYSGPLMLERTLELVRRVAGRVPASRLIIGSGGIDSAKSAYRVIQAGANLVEVYTSAIYQGPGVAGQINRGILTLMDHDNYIHVSQVNGRSLAADRE